MGFVRQSLLRQADGALALSDGRADFQEDSVHLTLTGRCEIRSSCHDVESCRCVSDQQQKPTILVFTDTQSTEGRGGRCDYSAPRMIRATAAGSSMCGKCPTP